MENIKKYEEKAELLKALSHPHRLCIIKGLLESKCNVTKIQECLGLPQSTVSQHLSKLKAAGIIDGERNGLEVCYSVVSDDAVNLIRILFNE
ncbi:MAG: metalloregulator ArsR/SmtB family transcription factor [Clostridia bacterium]|nr:metalloregulator ArsR/SmtB family transcription factor [Clostridia bacterium]